MAKSIPSFLSCRSSKSGVGWIHYWRYPGNCVFNMILLMITKHYLSFAMLFMQHWGYHHHSGDSLKVEFPTDSGNWCSLQQVADGTSRRLVRLFLPDDNRQKPCHGKNPPLLWRPWLQRSDFILWIFWWGCRQRFRSQSSDWIDGSCRSLYLKCKDQIIEST